MIGRRAVALALLVAAAAGLLLALTLAGVTGPLQLAGQALLVAAFLGLAIVDLRVATAVVVLELAVAGASGRWTVMPGGVSGRITIDAIVFVVALARLAPALRIRGRAALGRYGLHALAVAILLPAIWIPLGLANGNALADAWGDGNGYLFLAFALVLAALALQSELGWLRRWLLVSCAAAAALTAALAAVVLAGVVAMNDVNAWVIDVLQMGGVAAVLDGNVRLSLGSAVYLPVGVALVTWDLIERPRRAWPWLLLLLFSFALAVTYTRALWLAAPLAAMLVLLASVPSARRLALVVGATLAITLSATVAGWAVGFSLPDYVFNRLTTAFVLPDDSTNAYENEPGVVSNAIKVHQARVLLGHVAERPLTGWGFGAIAPDYRYGRGYSYELSYIALAYKAGLPGLLLFLTFPLRLLIDAVRVRLGRLPGPVNLTPRAAAVPLAMLVALLAVGAINPYLVAAFGLAPVVLAICWLDPFEPPAAISPVGG